MKTLKLFILVVSLFTFASVSIAQEMGPPKPIENKTFEMALGEWVSVPYSMMGTNNIVDKSKIYMQHNGQFMVVEVDAKGESGDNYTGTIYVTIDNNGGLKGWSFDTWGYSGIMNYTGTANDNVISLVGTNDWVSETRVITIDGNKMTHNVDFTLKLPTGDMNEKLEVVYNKK